MLKKKDRMILTSDKDNSLNNLAVLRALSTGSSFSQEEKFSTMNVQQYVFIYTHHARKLQVKLYKVVLKKALTKL